LTNEPLVSVIIPSKNSSTTIKKCLESIKNQTYDSIETIVVDNNSDDTTIEIAKKYADKVFNIGPERSTQVNYGVEMANGKYIYRIDSDFELEPTVIYEAVKAAETNNFAAVLIHNTSDPSPGYWARVRKFERDMYEEGTVAVAVRFIRRDIYLSVGGYDSTMVAGEDYDLHNRIVDKYQIGIINAKELHLREYTSLVGIAKKNYYYGKTVGPFLRKNKSRGLKQFSPFRKVYLKHYKKFISHPTLSTGFVIYQIVRYGAGFIGIIVHILRFSN
jgi:glycosyltransferase involved in cell wall biosynthesis